MGLNGGVCKLIQENFNNKKYPPLFQLNVIWYVGFCLAVEIKCDLQIAPVCNVKLATLRAKCFALFRMSSCQCDVSTASFLTRLG
jgi:hypothetical protein